MTTGLIIGKFMPPHAGHVRLVEFAARRVDRLSLVVFTKAHEPIPGELRLAWLRELFPDVELLPVTQDGRVDYASPAAWDFWVAAIREVHPAAPDLVFTSEAYGDELARDRKSTRLNSSH